MSRFEKEDNYNILIVDDNKDIHEDYKKILTKKNTGFDELNRRELLFGKTKTKSANSLSDEIAYNLDSAYQGKQAIEMVEKALQVGSPYAMAFVDCRMPPGMDGVETIQKIWELDPRIQIVFCTAYSDYGLDDLHDILGVSDSLLIIKKPFDSIVVKQATISLVKKWNLNKKNKYLQHYLKSIIDSMPSIIIGVDMYKNVTHWNKLAEKETGISIAKAIGQPLKDVFTIFEDKEEKIHDAIIGGNMRYFPRIHLKENQSIYKDIMIYPIIMQHVEKGAVVRIDDVTELEQKDAQLRQIQKMETVGNLAGGLAHDFNNMLGGIKGALSMFGIYLEKDLVDKPQLRRFLSLAEKSTDRASDMVVQLLGLSKKQEPEFSAIDLNSAVRDIVKLAENTFDKSIALNVEYFEEKAFVYADITQIEQVLLNLCINSSHAMTFMKEQGEHKGGALTVSVEKLIADETFYMQYPDASNPEYWIIKITDTGVGIKPETITKMFDPFFTTKKDRGTGLGLAMVNNIIKQQNGFIDVDSQVGVGTTFSLYLPVFESELDSAKPEKKKQYEKGSGLILVVDDEEFMRMAAESLLRECGYDVIAASDGMDAVNTYRDRHDEISAVLLDMAMPKMSGPEAYSEMEKIDPNVKVLLTSGFKDKKRIENVFKLGINGFIHKPFSIIELSKEIKRIVEL